MSLESLNIPADVMAAGEAMLGGGDFQLEIPEGVVRDRHWARWDELVVVESATHRVDGDVYIFAFKTKVLPGGQYDTNVGKIRTEFMRYNFKALSDPTSGQAKMSHGTAAKLKKIAVAAGLNLSHGLDGATMVAMFPDEAAMPPQQSLLDGRKFIVTFSDDDREDKQYKGKNQQQIDAIVPAPEGA